MIIDDGRLIAFLDDELDAVSRIEVEAALSADPLLAARLMKLRSVRARLSQTYDPLAQDAVHERVANGRDNVVRLADRRQPSAAAKPRLNLKWPAWGGIAATFAGGLVLGYAAAHEGGGALTVRGDGVLMARGDLVRALNENHAGH
jgi:anti-sigma factor RsiW